MDRMLGVLVAQDISRVLQHYVLEPSASAEARDTILPGESDRPQGLLKILVRTARGHPHTAEPVEERVIDFRCRTHSGWKGAPRNAASVEWRHPWPRGEGNAESYSPNKAIRAFDSIMFQVSSCTLACCGVAGCKGYRCFHHMRTPASVPFAGYRSPILGTTRAGSPRVAVGSLLIAHLAVTTPAYVICINSTRWGTGRLLLVSAGLPLFARILSFKCWHGRRR